MKWGALILPSSYSGENETYESKKLREHNKHRDSRLPKLTQTEILEIFELITEP